MKRALTALTAAVLLSEAGCSAFPGDPPPETCSAGEIICYYEPIQDRDLVLRCNDGEVDGAIWIVEEACQPDEVCVHDKCVLP